MHLERWILRTSHVAILLICFVLASIANMSGAQDVLNGGFLLFSLRLLSIERQLVLSRGKLWRYLRVYAWLVLLLKLFFQAPIIPASCASAFSRTEVLGVPWCTLLMTALGLFKMKTNLQTDQDCSMLSPHTYCSGSMGGMLRTVTIWFFVDLQSRLFQHPLYQQEVQEWHKRRDLRGHACALMTANKALLSRRLYVRRQQIWKEMTARKLQDIVFKLEAAEAMIRGTAGAMQGASSRAACPPPCAAARTDSQRSGACSRRSMIPDAHASCAPNEIAIVEQMHRHQLVDGLAHACRQLSDVGFDSSASHKALLVCGVMPGQPRVSSQALLRALTLLLESELDAASAPTSSEDLPPHDAVASDTEAQVAGSSKLSPELCEGPDSQDSKQRSAKGTGCAAYICSCWLQICDFIESLRDPILFGEDGPESASAPEWASSLLQTNYAAVGKPRKFKFFVLLLQAFLSNSQSLVWTLMIVNHAVNTNLLSLQFPLALFLYGIIESPQPSSGFFRFQLGYVLLLLVFKFLYQLPIACGSPPLSFRSSSISSSGGMEDLAVCYDENFAISRDWEEVQVILPDRVDYVLGLHKFMKASSLPHNEGLFLGVLPDLLYIWRCFIFAALLERSVTKCCRLDPLASLLQTRSARLVLQTQRQAKMTKLLSPLLCRFRNPRRSPRWKLVGSAPLALQHKSNNRHEKTLAMPACGRRRGSLCTVRRALFLSGYTIRPKS